LLVRTVCFSCHRRNEIERDVKDVRAIHLMHLVADANLGPPA